VAPTGVGKMVILAGNFFFSFLKIVHRFSLQACPFMLPQLPKKVLFVTPNINVATTIRDQRFCYSFLKKYGICEGLPKDCVPKVLHVKKHTEEDTIRRREVFVWNYQGAKHDTLLEQFPVNCFDLIVVDEAHHSTSAGYSRILSHFATARRVFVTATPFRSDRVSINADTVYEFTMLSAIEQNYVKEPVWSPVPVTHMKLSGNRVLNASEIEHMSARSASFQKAVEESEKCQKLTIEYASWWLIKARSGNYPQARCIAYAESTANAKAITLLWRKTCPALRIEYVDGETRKYDRYAISRQLQADVKDSTAIDVVVNCRTLLEGFDEPNLCIVALFSRISSLPQFAQFVGRCVRRCPSSVAGLQQCLVISHPGIGIKPAWEAYCGGHCELDRLSFRSEEDECVIVSVSCDNLKSAVHLPFRQCAKQSSKHFPPDNNI
jgi:DNA repair protein RadD